MLRGTPPKKAKAASCPSQNASAVSAGYAFTKQASECGRSTQKKWIRRCSPPITATASPKSACPCPGGCTRGTNISRPRSRRSRTKSFTIVSPPAKPCSARSRWKTRRAVCRCLRGRSWSSSRILLVLFQDPVDGAGEPVELGACRRLAAPVARRHRKAQHLRHRLGVDAEHPRRLPLAHPLHMAGAPYPRVEIHSLHPPGLPSTTGTESRRSALQFRAAAAGLPSCFREGVSLRRSHPGVTHEIAMVDQSAFRDALELK